MLKRYWRKNKALLLALGGVLALCLIYCAGLPLVGMLASKAPPEQAQSQLLSDIWSQMLECIVGLWLFMFGGAIGSFLNVVVWRIPLGMSIAAGGSRCPFCRTEILLADNIPIFGWIKLRGRCRSCRLPISPRYPLVELALATAFLLVAISELFFACSAMPALDPPAIPGFSQILLWRRWDLGGVFFYHTTLVTLLVGAALFSLDGNRTPVSYNVFALLVATLVLIWPVLHPIAPADVPLQGLPPWMIAGLSLLTGAAVGLAGGLILAVTQRFVSGATGAGNIVFMFVWTGAFLGWKLVLLAGPMAILLASLALLNTRQRWSWRVTLPFCTCIVVLALLMHLDQALGYPVANVSPWIFAVVCGVFWPCTAALLAMVTRYCQSLTLAAP